MITAAAFAGNRYAVLGLARSGMASVAALVASGAEVTAWDAREEPRRTLAEEMGPRIAFADPCVIDLAGMAGVVVSPGIPLNRHPIRGAAQAAGVPLIGDIELFAQGRSALPPHRVVGITGTNGKSTTTALIHHICETAGLPSLMGGNIGLPILAQAPLHANAAGEPVYVLELSSYQIDLTHSLDCELAVLLNVTPDHLDRYDSFADYRAAKMRLFAMQGAGRHAIVEPRLGPAWLARQAGWPALQGPHNAQNAAAAVAVAEALGIGAATIDRALGSFGGLPHRMERVAQWAGVHFINDSKATNPASTAPALAAFPPVGGHRRLHWILGGLPKGDALDECAPFFSHIAAAYLIGEAGPQFAEILAGHMPVNRSEMLCDAIRQAMAAAAPGDVVLLSPACASFDQFRDYEARGQAFRDIVTALIGEGYRGRGKPAGRP